MPIRYVWGLVGIAIGIGVIIAVEKPLMFDSVTDKVDSIQVGKPPIGDLTPARDLTGAWDSSLKGKGFQLYGEFVVAEMTTKVYEEGDIEILIESVVDNVAYGRARFYNVTVYGQGTGPAGTVTLPRTKMAETGLQPIQIRVSGSRLDFGSFGIAGTTGTMQGNFVTDIISGTMATTVPPYGAIKGEFRLSRRRE